MVLNTRITYSSAEMARFLCDLKRGEKRRAEQRKGAQVPCTVLSPTQVTFPLLFTLCAICVFAFLYWKSPFLLRTASKVISESHNAIVFVVSTLLSIFLAVFLYRMLRLLGVFLIGLIVADSYKILVYSPKFGHSHSNFMGRIADIMAEAGHDVVRSTFISPLSHCQLVVALQTHRVCSCRK